MQIQNVKLANWKNFEAKDFSPAKFNLLLGKNGSGKTSILEAIKCLLNGKTPPDHVRSGASGCAISADLENIGCIERAWGGGKSQVRLNGKVTTQKSVTEAISDLCGFSASTTNLMSSSEVLMEMFGKDMSEYLLSFLKNDMTVDHLLELVSVSDEAENEVRCYFPEAPAQISLQDINTAWEDYKLQTNSLKNKSIALSAQAVYAGATPKRTATEVENDLYAATTALGKLEALEKTYLSSKNAYDQHQSQMASLQAKIDAVHSTPPTATEYQSVKNQITEAQNRIAEITASGKSWKETKIRLSTILNNLSTSICPISDKLICTTDKTGLREELQGLIADCDTNLVALRASLMRENETIKTLSKQAETMELALREAEALKATKENLAALKKMTITLPKKPNAEAKQLQLNLVEQLRLEKQLAEDFARAQNAKKELEEVEKRLRVFKELTTLFSPKGGARKKVLEYNIAPLQDYCSTITDRILPKYKIILDTENGLHIKLLHPSGEQISFESASNGEKIRIMFILTDMLNQLNGFKVLMLDNLDGLDADSFSELCKVVMENADMYDHIFMAAVNTSEIEEKCKLFPIKDTQRLI